MRSFTLKPDAYAQLRKASVRETVIISVLILVVFIFFNAGNFHGKEMYSSIFTFVTMELIALFVTYKSLKRYKRMFETFRLTITEDKLIREQYNTPDITIARQSVKEIIKAHNGAFGIIGDSKLNGIMVPTHINDADELERLLSEIRPIHVKTSHSLWEKLLLPIAIAGAIAAGWGLLNENKYIFTAAGLATCAFLVAGFVLIRKSKNLDRGIKRFSYMTVIPLLSILAAIIAKWMGKF